MHGACPCLGRVVCCWHYFIQEKVSMKAEQQNIFKALVLRYGIDAQLDMLMEESAELIQSVNKVKRFKNSEKQTQKVYEMAYEIADVLNMIEQISEHFELKAIIKEAREAKLKKQEEKLVGTSDGIKDQFLVCPSNEQSFPVKMPSTGFIMVRSLDGVFCPFCEEKLLGGAPACPCGKNVITATH